MTQDYLLVLITLAVLYLKRSSFPNRVIVVMSRDYVNIYFIFNFFYGMEIHSLCISQYILCANIHFTHGEFTHLILTFTKISTHYRLAQFNLSHKHQKHKSLQYHLLNQEIMMPSLWFILDQNFSPFLNL